MKSTPTTRPVSSDQGARAERVRAGAGAEIEHAVARPERREVEVVADTCERGERRVRDGRQQRLRIAEPQREVASGLEVPWRERVACDAAVDVLHLAFELGAVDERRRIRTAAAGR